MWTSSEIYQMNSASEQLSDYQRGVLNELGIVCWKKQADNTKAGSQKQTNISLPPAKPLVNATSKEAALNKLQQLKTEQATVSYAGKVICSFAATANLLPLMQDIMQALGLNDYSVVTLSKTELVQAKDYALRWQFGDKIELSAKQLTTPDLSKLNDPSQKKHLWQLIQNHAG